MTTTPNDLPPRRASLGIGIARRLGAATGTAVSALTHSKRVVVGFGRSAWHKVASGRPADPKGMRSASGSLTNRLWRRDQAVIRDVPFEAARVASDQGLGALSRTLADPDPAVRVLAVDVVCEFAEGRAAKLLSGILCDPDAGVRAAAAAATGRVRATGAVFSLILALDDPDRHVRDAASHALREITGKDPELGLDDDPVARHKRVMELKRWWKEQRFSQLAAEIEEEEQP